MGNKLIRCVFHVFLFVSRLSEPFIQNWVSLSLSKGPSTPCVISTLEPRRIAFGGANSPEPRFGGHTWLYASSPFITEDHAV